MTELASLAEEVGVSERTLRRAVGQGTLRASRATPRTLQLALSERHYIRRSWSLVSTLRRTLRTEPNVRFALLFGSASTGTDTATSDFDVLVDLRDPSLESAMASFGEDFDAKRFKEAFDTTEDMEAYNRVQALERAVGRVQNFDAEPAITGAKLAELPCHRSALAARPPSRHSKHSATPVSSTAACAGS